MTENLGGGLNNFSKWCDTLNDIQEEKLKRDNKDLQKDWTEEVIIPEILYKKLLPKQRNTWIYCDLHEIYSSQDILDIFGVDFNELNDCFSRKFYKLTLEELKVWEHFGNSIDSELPIRDILIIYSQ